MPEPTKQQTSKPSDYKVLFANAFGLRIFASGDVNILFAVDLDPENPGQSLHEQVGIGTNLRALKLLSNMLAEAVRKHEEAAGEVIDTGQDVIEESVQLHMRKPGGTGKP